jgi:putative tryptophan/tyrosine transport system substrate-binding protein
VTTYTRRQVVQGMGAVGLGLLAGCGRWPGQAQPSPKVPRIGWLSPEESPPPRRSEGASQGPVDIFREGLRELGYVEGQNITIEYRYADGSSDALVEHALELARSPVDLLVAFGAPSSFAARQATQTIPIVMLGGPPDPIGSGIISSYAQPGGNVTGLTALPVGLLSGKYFELLKEVSPGLSKMARLYDGGAGPLASPSAERSSDSAAASIGVQVLNLTVHGPDELEHALEVARREGADALQVTGTPLFTSHAKLIAEFALQHRWPAIAPWRVFPAAGLLMSYGAGGLPGLARRAAALVDKILKGARPADLPVEQPMTFDFVINLRTAHILGLTIPPHILYQATEVIQ